MGLAARAAKIIDEQKKKEEVKKEIEGKKAAEKIARKDPESVLDFIMRKAKAKLQKNKESTDIKSVAEACAILGADEKSARGIFINIRKEWGQAPTEETIQGFLDKFYEESLKRGEKRKKRY